MPKLTFTSETEVTIEALAQLFCALSDEEMADFFERVGKIADGWGYSGAAEFQFWSVGRHMRTCACVTDLGKNVIEAIHESMTHNQEERHETTALYRLQGQEEAIPLEVFSW